MEKKFNGKAIYNPSGKAGEYSRWACNFFIGCSNDCTYCYCKKGYLGLIWTDKPQLKKCFRDTEDAFRIFSTELLRNLDDLRKHGLFFTFTSDPMLPDSKPLILRSMDFALENGVPVQILTKCAEFAHDIRWQQMEREKRGMVAFGFTLTGCDDLESGAASTADRITAMRRFHQLGYPTFASIEPVVIPSRSLDCIRDTSDCCDLFKVGLMSGKKDYSISDVRTLFEDIKEIKEKTGNLFYLKDSFVNFLQMDRNTLDEGFVDLDYPIYNLADRD